MEHDYARLINIMQQIAAATIESSSPVDVQIGDVTSTSPLSIHLQSKLEIPEELIVLTKNTTCWTAYLTVDHITEDASGGSGEAAYAPHHHGYAGTKPFVVHNELQVGDKVIMLREAGGQRYIALDRCYNPDEGCKDR